MKVRDAILALLDHPMNSELMIIDGENGNGVPRTLNLGPVAHRVTRSEVSETSDCDNLAGKDVTVIGYGCY